MKVYRFSAGGGSPRVVMPDVLAGFRQSREIELRQQMDRERLQNQMALEDKRLQNQMALENIRLARADKDFINQLRLKAAGQAIDPMGVNFYTTKEKDVVVGYRNTPDAEKIARGLEDGAIPRVTAKPADFKTNDRMEELLNAKRRILGNKSYESVEPEKRIEFRKYLQEKYGIDTNKSQSGLSKVGSGISRGTMSVADSIAENVVAPVIGFFRGDNAEDEFLLKVNRGNKIVNESLNNKKSEVDRLLLRLQKYEQDKAKAQRQNDLYMQQIKTRDSAMRKFYKQTPITQKAREQTYRDPLKVKAEMAEIVRKKIQKLQGLPPRERALRQYELVTAANNAFNQYQSEYNSYLKTRREMAKQEQKLKRDMLLERLKSALRRGDKESELMLKQALQKMDPLYKSKVRLNNAKTKKALSE